MLRLTHVVAATIHPEDVHDLGRDLSFRSIANQAIHSTAFPDVLFEETGKLSI